MKFAFAAKHRSIWPGVGLCEALDVSHSGFHAWLKRRPAPAGSGRMSWRKASPAAYTASSG